MADSAKLLSDWERDQPPENRLKLIPPDDSRHICAISALQMAEKFCEKIPLGTLHEEIRAAVSEHQGIAYGDRLRFDLERIADRFRRELSGEHFRHVEKDAVGFYGNKELFGELVAKKFKPIAGDLESAGNCLALGEGTACVLHLMRAMEVVVKRLAKRLGMSITPKTTWRQLSGSMDSKIKKMPEVTEAEITKKDAWRTAAVSLDHIGSVWRNRTMHPNKRYTVQQAREILEATRVFMNSYAKLSVSW